MRLPIGIQSFRQIREDGLLYIDKTMYYERMLQTGRYLFLSRPRRFGKSLLLSTFKSIFEGNKALFKGLYIEDKIDFTPLPVIEFDFFDMDYQTNSLASELERVVEQQAQKHGVTLTTTSGPKVKFSELLQKLGKSVVLIDEYDKPVTDLLGTQQQGEHVEYLKSFYGVLKSQSERIAFCLITGVSKFGKMSVFSDLNHLQDITLHPEFATMLGITQAELEQYFAEDLNRIAAKSNLTMAVLLAQIKRMYNGYAWSDSETLYCPFSLLSYLSSGQMLNYWFETGTPTFLTKLLKDKSFLPTDLEQFTVGQATVQSGDIRQADPISLLFQTGYLTIKALKTDFNGSIDYTLGYPNEEVRRSFSLYLMAAYADQNVSDVEKNVAGALKIAILGQKWDDVRRIINVQLANVSHLLHRADEAWYHAMTHLAFNLTGFKVVSEYSTAQGRIDNVLFDGVKVYIIEYKVDQNAKAALDQIEKRQYALPFDLSTYPVTRVGINFNTQIRQIDDLLVE